MKAKMISLKETAEMIGKSENTIRNWIRGFYWKNGQPVPCNVDFPQAYKFRNTYSFREIDITRWIEQQKCPTC